MFDAHVHLVFDLDDTLYPEIEYARSGLRFVGELVETVFAEKNATAALLRMFEDGERDAIGALWTDRGLPPSAKRQIVAAMHGHRPDIVLPPASVEVLGALSTQGIKWSILTDGRSLTQRRKIEALGLSGASGIYISEEKGVAKPALKAYTQIEDDHPEARAFWYTGDNPAKDFVAPNALGWKTILLRDHGQNIHPQDQDVPKAFRAALEINELTEIVASD